MITVLQNLLRPNNPTALPIHSKLTDNRHSKQPKYL